MISSLKLQLANANNVDEICNLINLAYRGDIGWTTEATLVSGNRSTQIEVEQYIADPNATLLIAYNHDEIVSCICIEMNDGGAYIGFFAVHPKLQGKGVGKAILSQAENYALINLKARKYLMAVVGGRKELIAYYERRGYCRTGKIEDFPVHRDVGTPLQDGLTIEYMEKNI